MSPGEGLITGSEVDVCGSFSFKFSELANAIDEDAAKPNPSPAAAKTSLTVLWFGAADCEREFP